jgi:predicted negative regulator of RcsB-dependent stress response
VREDLEQQEQLDAIKGFWHDNRWWILGLLVVIFGSWAAWAGWQAYTASKARAANQAYGPFAQAFADQNLKAAAAAAKVLFEQHGQSAQADMAGLQLAKLQHGAGEFEPALASLGQVIKSKDAVMAWTARLRAAAIQIDQNKFDQALAVLAETPPASFEPDVLDRRGDIHALMNRKDEARSAWAAAKSKPGISNALTALLDRKLAALDAQVTPSR